MEVSGTPDVCAVGEEKRQKFGFVVDCGVDGGCYEHFGFFLCSIEEGWKTLHQNFRREIKIRRSGWSFAWRSVQGSDCAGLITFHRLSDRLTRVELNLDVLPTSAADAVTLSTHLAHRRAAFDLRRLKATLELINPDLYE